MANSALNKILLAGQLTRLRTVTVRATGEKRSEECPTQIAKCREYLEKEGYEYTVAQSLEEAISIINNQKIDGAIVDPWLPTADEQAAVRARSLLGEEIPLEAARKMVGILLDEILRERRIGGVFLDTEATNEGVLWLLASGLSPEQNLFKEALENYEKRTRSSRWLRHWICNCACCAVGPLDEEILWARLR